MDILPSSELRCYESFGRPPKLHKELTVHPLPVYRPGVHHRELQIGVKTAYDPEGVVASFSDRPFRGFRGGAPGGDPPQQASFVSVTNRRFLDSSNVAAHKGISLRSDHTRTGARYVSSCHNLSMSERYAIKFAQQHT